MHVAPVVAESHGRGRLFFACRTRSLSEAGVSVGCREAPHQIAHVQIPCRLHKERCPRPVTAVWAGRRSSDSELVLGRGGRGRHRSLNDAPSWGLLPRLIRAGVREPCVVGMPHRVSSTTEMGTFSLPNVLSIMIRAHIIYNPLRATSMHARECGHLVCSALAMTGTNPTRGSRSIA